jgi:predicted Zn-dependent peptidase
MKRHFLFLTLTAVCCSLFSQGTYKEIRTEGTYPYTTVSGDPTQTRTYVLKNGLTVMLSVNKEKPRIQTYIATKAGSKNDPHDHTGLAHYLEHMLFKGTDTYGTLDWAKEKPLLDKIQELYEMYNHTTDTTIRKDIYRQIDKISGEASHYSIANEYDKMMSSIGAKGTNAFTSFEVTAYVNDIPSNQLDKWLTVEAERYRNPVFRIFHTELEAVYEEKNRGIDNDYWQWYELAYAELFKKHTYGTQTTIGTIEHLKNPSLIAIRNYYETYYVPNNMVVIMAGDLDPDQCIKSIDKYLGTLAAKPVPAFNFLPEDPLKANVEQTIYGPMEEFTGLFYRLPSAATNDARMMKLMTSVLNRLLTLNLNQKQLVLETQAGLDGLKDYSAFYITGYAREGQDLDEVKRLILQQIEILKSGRFDDAMLKAIINNYKLERIQKNESNDGRAYDMLDNFILGRNWKDACADLDEISKISKKQLMEFASKHLTNYVCIHKKNGTSERSKVSKPPITPVETNRDSSSGFVKNFMDMKAAPIAPRFVDFTTDMSIGEIRKDIPLHYIQNKENGLFTLYYVFDFGSYNNRKLPFAFDYLNYAGTDKYSAEQINTEFYKLACSYGINAGNEQSYVYLSGLQENFEPALKLFEHFINNIKPDDEAVKKMIEAEFKNRSDNKLNKGTIRQALSQYASYGPVNPFNDVLSKDDLLKITAAELCGMIKTLKNYKHKTYYYGPSAQKDIRSKVGSLHNTPATFLTYAEPKKYTRLSTQSTHVYFAHFDMVQSEIVWQHNNQRTYDPANAPAISVFNEYFGGNMGSLVFQTIRESKALAYSTYASFSTPSKKTDPYTVIAYVGCQADKFGESIQAMNELLHNMPGSEKLLQSSKDAILKNIETQRTTKAAIFFRYDANQKLGLTGDINRDIYARVPSMGVSELMQFYNSFMKPNQYNYCIVANREKIKKADLEKLGPYEEVSLEKLFGY